MIHQKTNNTWVPVLFSALVLACSLSISTSVVAQNGLPTHGVTPITVIGIKGLSLNLPTDIAVDDSGNVYIVDSGNDRVVVANKRGRLLREIGQSGNKSGQFRDPVGIAIDSNRQIYVADRGNNRIQIFNSSGEYVSGFTTTHKGKPVIPVDVAVDALGRTIFVTGNANHRVMAYSSQGKLIRHWGGEGVDEAKFRFPATIALTPNDRIYVVDILNTRVQVFDTKGNHIVDVGEWGILPGQLFRPKGVAVDGKGNIYVSDSYMEVIQVFDHDHRFSHVIGAKGKPRRFTTPVGLFVDNRQRLYVTEMLKNQISVYSIKK